jgi:hypothetical protein
MTSETSVDFRRYDGHASVSPWDISGRLGPASGGLQYRRSMNVAQSGDISEVATLVTPRISVHFFRVSGHAWDSRKDHFSPPGTYGVTYEH